MSFAEQSVLWTCTTSSLLSCGITPIHRGETLVWNRERFRATWGSRHHWQQRKSATSDALVWRGDAALPEVEQGMKILGTPLGYPDYVQSFFHATTEAHAGFVGLNRR